MPRAIVLREPCEAAAMRMETVTVGAPAAGEIRLRQTAIGVNFHDIYVRNGLYKTLPLPGIPGIEAAGVVDAIGPGVNGLVPGDRVGYVTPRYGAYASERILPADLAIPLPAFLDDRTAAPVLVRGLTVEVLVRAAQPGNRVLVQAAAGGVGRLLCQKLKSLGATIIGTAGSPERAEIARKAGCDHVILYRQDDFVAAVRDLTNGRGVDVAYDSVGKDTFMGSLDCLALRGHLVNFGQSSGSVPPFEVSRLAARSNTVSRPIVFHYIADRRERDAMAAALFQDLEMGILTADPATTLPLAEAGAAHAAMEARTAAGPIVLLP